MTCNNACLPLKHNTRHIEHFNANVKRGLSCPCSAINTLPGEDGHRARCERYESGQMALETLSSNSVHKASWHGEENSWTAGWGGAQWWSKSSKRSVSVVCLLFFCCYVVFAMNEEGNGIFTAIFSGLNLKWPFGCYSMLISYPKCWMRIVIGTPITCCIVFTFKCCSSTRHSFALSTTCIERLQIWTFAP